MEVPLDRPPGPDAPGPGQPAASASFNWGRSALAELRDNCVDERSAAWMYTELAKRDADPQRSKLLSRLAAYEVEHAQGWEGLLAALGARLPRGHRMTDHRILVGLARVFGVASVLPIIHKQEVDGIDKYRRQASEWTDPRAQRLFASLLPDEISHEIDLLADIRRVGATKGRLRSAILGANDGLASNLALVAGVAGGTVAAAASQSAVILAGAAGLVAGAFSMAAANYVSTKAEQEVVSSQRRLAKQAVAAAPQHKKEQVKAHLVSKGLDDAEAAAVVERVASTPNGLMELVLAAEGIEEPSVADRPLGLAGITGIAFAVAAFIPLLPFLLLPLWPALWWAVGLSGGALFLAGVLRSLWTLFPFVKSGAEMVAVGLGSAAVTYVVGLAIGQAI